jgi:hypothetical protein
VIIIRNGQVTFLKMGVIKEVNQMDGKILLSKLKVKDSDNG